MKSIIVSKDRECLKSGEMKLIYRKKFKSRYEQFKERDTQKFSVIKVIDTPDETHDAECLPMFRIKFEDGYETDAWPEEVLL